MPIFTSLRGKMMTTFNWLHITDLHCGMPGQEHLWPNVKDKFLDDLHKLHEISGPWQVVFFTGDLVQSGEKEEFERLNKLLEELWNVFDRLGSRPLLIPVPGNHDLVRPSGKSPAVRLLSKWENNPEIHDEFWGEQSSDYRRIVENAFFNYLDWFGNCPWINSAEINKGLLPGDFSISLKQEDIRIGVVGLNTTFLQLTSAS